MGFKKMPVSVQTIEHFGAGIRMFSRQGDARYDCMRLI